MICCKIMALARLSKYHPRKIKQYQYFIMLEIKCLSLSYNPINLNSNPCHRSQRKKKNPRFHRGNQGFLCWLDGLDHPSHCLDGNQRNQLPLSSMSMSAVTSPMVILPSPSTSASSMAKEGLLEPSSRSIMSVTSLMLTLPLPSTSPVRVGPV